MPNSNWNHEICIEDGRLEAARHMTSEKYINASFYLEHNFPLTMNGLMGGFVAREIGANINNIAFPVNLH